MSRWLALASGATFDPDTPPDNLTKPDSTLTIQPNEGFCQVLSNCQISGEGESSTLKPASNTNDMQHGFASTGHLKTWTGKIVSLDAWRQLSEWDRHGPDQRQWNGKTNQWGSIK
ncbi:hypothetical protein [Roseovarius arcticus]|uniref:hypothetical protein n=1 Tax=Roseovarius arcticus TaxID=2547404 RepID=UPI001110428A|nr:hypothetical protein [Roseovarius arcticus]